ncbi:MAG: hypothetical protein U0768_21245 [Anaerolineae bacterium]
MSRPSPDPAPPPSPVLGEGQGVRGIRRLLPTLLALFALFALAVALSWPMARDFTTKVLSDGEMDIPLNIWVLWHAKEALLGHQPLLYANLLYYPVGTSMLTQSPGPLLGLLALPFWGFGAAAAYNATLLLALWLSGVSMYLLARDLGLDRLVALFSAAVLMAAPMVLGGLPVHMDKVFIALLPLALLAWRRALDPARSVGWVAVTAVIVLLTLLHGGWHFIQVMLAIAFFGAAAWLEPPEKRGRLGRRQLLFLFFVAVYVGPFLFATLRAASSAQISLDRTEAAFRLQPDAIQFLLPAGFSRLLGEPTLDLLAAYKIPWTIESAIGLAWVPLALAVVGLVTTWRKTRAWALLLALCMLLALGPQLSVFGERTFTKYDLPVALPYALVTSLPGLSFMRTPGRFMMLGSVILAVLAGYGLAWLVERRPRWRHAIVAGAALLVLIPAWPVSWPQEALRPPPAFYQQIAADPEHYGVFDLPLRTRQPYPEWWIPYTVRYQLDQMTHGKGIAAGYLSFVYREHPLFPCWYAGDQTPGDVTINGQKVSCFTNAQYELARNGYRYVVLHKAQPDFPDFDDLKPGSWMYKVSHAFVDAALPGVAPIADDDMVTVYPVPINAAPIAVTMEMRDGWEERDNGERWAQSPATLYIVSPTAQPAVLQIEMGPMHEAAAPGGIGSAGRLRVQLGDETQTLEVRAGETVDVPLSLAAGGQTVTLTLEAGSFRPADYGMEDTRALSFAVRGLNLATAAQ